MKITGQVPILVKCFKQGFQPGRENVSQKFRIFSKKNFRRKFRILSHFVRLRKAQNFAVICFTKNSNICLTQKCEHFAKSNENFFQENLMRKYGRELINYDIVKLLMLSSQSREFQKFFAQLIVEVKKLMRNFSKKSATYERIFSHFFTFFRESFRSLETLVSSRFYLIIQMILSQVKLK